MENHDAAPVKVYYREDQDITFEQPGRIGRKRGKTVAFDPTASLISEGSTPARVTVRLYDILLHPQGSDKASDLRISQITNDRRE